MVQHTIGPDGRPYAFIDLHAEKLPIELTAYVGDHAAPVTWPDPS